MNKIKDLKYEEFVIFDNGSDVANSLEKHK